MQWHKDLALAVQTRLEEIVQDMMRYWSEQTGIRNLCISGGVGLNVKMNGNLFYSGLVDELFIDPVCSDAGASIAGALTLYHELEGLEVGELENLYHGPGYTNEEIYDILTTCKIKFTKEESIEKATAKLLAEGKIIGWYQGRSEAGPRALGARSILADPRTVDSRDKVNGVIKYREMWRPFCPSMLEEGAERYFDEYAFAPFMITTYRANDRAREEVPAIVHVDGTSRPQMVREAASPRYYKLLKEFEALTGVPVLLNTSFNVKGEPMIESPHDAIRTFYATGMDALAIGNALVIKS